MGGLPARRTVYGFTVHPKDPSIMFAASLRGLYQSRDAGKKWTLIAPKLQNLASVAVNPKRPEVIFVATLDGIIYRSNDGGKNLEAVKQVSKKMTE